MVLSKCGREARKRTVAELKRDFLDRLIRLPEQLFGGPHAELCFVLLRTLFELFLKNSAELFARQFHFSGKFRNGAWRVNIHLQELNHIR